MYVTTEPMRGVYILWPTNEVVIQPDFSSTPADRLVPVYTVGDMRFPYVPYVL